MARKKQQNAHWVDPLLLAALGQLVVEFNLLESVLWVSIWELLGCEQRVAHAITAQLRFKELVNAFCSLYYLRTTDPGILTSVQSLRVRLTAAEERRNQLLHSLWASAPGSLVVRMRFSAKAKRGWAVQALVVSATDVTAVADEVAALSSEVMTLQDTYQSLAKRDAGHAKTRTPPER